MRLLSVQYENIEQEWKFDKIIIFDLTLLVGISGVGKTQILQSIYDLKRIAKGASPNGIKWEVEFQILSGKEYIWKGEFENIKDKDDFLINIADSENENAKPKIIFEELLDKNNNELIIKRNTDSFIFNDKEMPKLTSNESALNILKEEDLIKDIYNGFKLIIPRDHTQKEGVRYSNLSVKKLKEKFDTFEKIKDSDLDTFHKLALIYDISKSTFDDIKNRFIEVFPQIEDIKIEPIQDHEFSNFIFEATVIQIKEKGVNKWIPHNRMSSGMLRTLLHIAEMYLWNTGTVVLIDEFENSLGLNCIDVLTEDIMYDNDNIQFIATSHHPYIINKIPYDYWKIVTRKGGQIKTFDAKDFDFGKSHHDRFMNLINHPLFKQGIS
ncbi:MAG: ATP-binding protein [Tannerella sp.]|jgi:predicted ATPase|nr:ATP-binding protein [Tannerella sp.]